MIAVLKCFTSFHKKSEINNILFHVYRTDNVNFLPYFPQPIIYSNYVLFTDESKPRKKLIRSLNEI